MNTDQKDQELALRAIAILQKQNEASGGLMSSDGVPLSSSRDLQDVIRHWTKFFRNGRRAGQ